MPLLSTLSYTKNSVFLCALISWYMIFPFFFILLAFWLSFNIMFHLISYPCDSVHRPIKMFYGRQSLTLITQTSVQIFVFNYYLMDLQCTCPYPNNVPPTVWIFRSGSTLYTYSNHVHSWMRFSFPITLLSLIFCFRNCSRRVNFALSYIVLLATLMHRNGIASSISGIPPFPLPQQLCKYTVQCVLLLLIQYW